MDRLPVPDLSTTNLCDSIEEFFTKEELEKMCDYEKNRYKNIRKNYEMLKCCGLSGAKPEFMQRKQKRKPKQSTVNISDEASEAESDPEWLPKHKTPGSPVWNPPVQLPVKCETKMPAKMRKRKYEVNTCAEKDSDDHPHVYEFRKRKEINYMHVEIPDDDEFLYCEECNLDYPDDCPVHGPLDVFFDTVVPANSCDPERALHTLPAGLEVRQSGIPNAGLGVWASTFFPVRSRFGPYEGRKVTDPDVAHSSGYCWEIYREGHRSHFVDAKDRSVSNWMRYVNCACTSTEQNLTAYQYRGQIFYRSHCDIQPGAELLVWYGPDYGQELGITRDKACRSSGRLGPADGVFPCPHCRLAFSEIKYLERHTKRRHGHLRHVNRAQVARRDKDMSTNGTSLCRLSTNTQKHKQSKTDDLCDTSETCGESLTNRDTLDTHMTTDVVSRSHGNQTFGKTFTHLNLNAHMNAAKPPNKKCDTCGKTFTRSDDLNTQMRVHTGERPYICKTCNKTFTISCHLNRHMRTHTGERPYTCKTCDKTFIRSGHLSTHMRTHTGERPYTCKTCDKTFIRSGHLSTHMRTHTGERPYKCKTCDKTFIRSGHLSTHMRTHTGQRPYTCKTCDKTFIRSGDLSTHMRTHTGQRPYTCKTCNKKFTISCHLNRHMRTHTGERPYTCKTCGKTFIRSGDLSTHMRTHTGQRPYTCKTCGKTFIRSGDLSTHMRTHTGQRPYTCKTCGKTFIRSGDLSTHMRTHTGQRPYTCKTCGKTFIRSGDLSTHMRTHTGERPYKCKTRD